ncbi:hypothetical protein W97_09305 [Coniosporium apollinis CBS 100218]|uniref:Cytochrome P450 n=1 Tax=Coniosporium apollinis (strain CBS 100218) TaxID=1168221 RepID=R7Z7A6_CONA1|nr:uncharacterized protein W97_09305 [Coniosporium apollinis CBS 100218]EON70037.1 hypothetical protein W97_09305 [Coniosporium apollinis CBS 100218]
MFGYWLPAAAVLLVLYIVGGAIYRLFFHPLAKFPGPKLAAVTVWYEAYYDVVGKGQYIFKLKELHDKYGPIIRINPNELHIRDPDYYDTLYNQTNRLDKSDYFYRMLGNPYALFNTSPASLHRIRRSALNPFFSAQVISRFRPHLQHATDRLCERMAACAEHDEVIPLFYAYRCLTVDIISEFVFGSQLGLLDREDWGRAFYAAYRSLWDLSPLIRQFPIIMTAAMAMPRWMTAVLNPKALEVVDMFAAVDEETLKLLRSDPAEVEKKPYPVVMWELAKSEVTPPEEKRFEVLTLQANGLLSAGFETTGAALAHMTYCVLANPKTQLKLVRELEEAIPDPGNVPSWQVLEKLPYLSSVVKEGLRLTIGAVSRLPRINRTDYMRYKEWQIPPNTAVGMAALYVVKNPDVFHDPEAFIPERWLEPDAKELERHLVVFSKGTRSCIGINLAYAELYSVMATMFRRFPNLELFETTDEDMEGVHDYFAPMVRSGDKGLKVKVGRSEKAQ